jgi:RNA polymerase sigma-70 factor (ECF subfamily)
MSDENPFQDLIQRVRAGDSDAATELVKRYEAHIRRVVRVRLDARLGRLLDSMDICQSVMASFFVRAALGQYQLDTPEQLLNLLATMARNKLANQAARHQRKRRDNRRVTTASEEAADTAPSPSQQIANKDLLQEARRRLTEDERQVLDLRGQGMEWNEIAEQLGGSPEALRKKFTRGIDRVAQQLGLDES